jgi:hypothetical protein
MGNYGINQKSNVVERYDYTTCAYTVDAITSTGTYPVCVDSETSQSNAKNGRLTVSYDNGDDYVGCTNNTFNENNPSDTKYYCADKLYAYKHEDKLWKYNSWGKDRPFKISIDSDIFKTLKIEGGAYV